MKEDCETPPVPVFFCHPVLYHPFPVAPFQSAGVYFSQPPTEFYPKWVSLTQGP